jgi:hypothetical protein
MPLCLFILQVSSLILPADTHYVDMNNPSPQAPYTTWASAAVEIQEAIHQAETGDTVLVTNATYRLSSEILVTNGISLRSVIWPGTSIWMEW